ncbi:hypothetical protein CLOM_g12758 [Closterium sp. NIES-68]|nr:hypothetical protein CLOM_g21519 [Closterium sp. NIES-68]GJP53604.1 hypothetical protein CLOM_g12758 [Closterium sp. NIES-68]GJP69869.1 hypothetical protein CLOP_g874 [Closterium sp. NIES-67]
MLRAPDRVALSAACPHACPSNIRVIHQLRGFDSSTPVNGFAAVTPFHRSGSTRHQINQIKCGRFKRKQWFTLHQQSKSQRQWRS